MQWEGYGEEWEREHLLLRDGCEDIIRSFWSTSGLNLSKKFYADKDGNHRCEVCVRTFKRQQDLKAHRTRSGHHHEKIHKVTNTAKVDAELEKRKVMQVKLPKVKWKEKVISNC